MSKKKGDSATASKNFYREAVLCLEQFGCLNLIPASFIREYFMAYYHAVQVYYELLQTGYVGIAKIGEAMFRVSLNN